MKEAVLGGPRARKEHSENDIEMVENPVTDKVDAMSVEDGNAFNAASFNINAY